MNEEDYVIDISERGIILAEVAPALLGYGLTAKQIMTAFGVAEKDEQGALEDEHFEMMLGIMMFSARAQGAI